MRSLMSILLLILIGYIPLGAVQQPGAPARLPIIDMHLHAYKFDQLGNPPRFSPPMVKPPRARSDQEAIAATMVELRRFNIVKAVTSGTSDMVAQWHRENSDVVIPALYPRPSEPLPPLDWLRREFKAGRLEVLGELGLQYAGISPSDPKLAPYFALAEELDIPVGVHTGLGPPGVTHAGYPKFRASLGNPMLVEEFVARHPRLRLYLMHAGGGVYLQETIAIMKAYPQVYADLSTINWLIPRAEFHAYLEALVRAGLGKRLMFGSDQMVWPDVIELAIEGIESATFLTPEQKRDIFYNNAARFLRLEHGKPEKAGLP